MAVWTTEAPVCVCERNDEDGVSEWSVQLLKRDLR